MAVDIIDLEGFEIGDMEAVKGGNAIDLEEEDNNQYITLPQELWDEDKRAA